MLGNTGPVHGVLAADVPISVAGVGNASASASISRATTITATATSVSFVSIPSGTMEKAINALPHGQPEFYRVADGSSYALLTAYSVQGLQITYTLNSALTGKAQASIQASSAVNVGSSAAPLTANVSVSNNGQKVVISIPDAHYMFGVMSPVSSLSKAETPTGQVRLGKRNWITTCKTSDTCTDKKSSKRYVTLIIGKFWGQTE